MSYLVKDYKNCKRQELLKIDSILWKWEQIPITPMENIEQTTCVCILFWAGIPYPNGLSISHEASLTLRLILEVLPVMD